MSQSHTLKLAFGLSFEDLYTREGIVRLDSAFLKHLQATDASLRAKLGEVRANPTSLDHKPASEFIIQVARHVEDLIGELFVIEDELGSVARRHKALAPLYVLNLK